MAQKIPIKSVRKKAAEPDKKQDELKTLRAKLKKKETEVKALKKEKQKLNGDLLRQLADKENMRKRLEREKREFLQFALSELLSEMLTILDNFERALENADKTKDDNFLKGIEMIYKQYLDALKKQGVKPLELSDKRFDPNFHQAFATEESEDVNAPEIVEEFQKGYTLHERLLRPSLVKVVVPKKKG